MFGRDVQDIGQVAARLVNGAIEAAEPGRLLAEHITFEGERLVLGGRIYQPSAVTVISVGKASVAMAKTAAARLGPLLSTGVVVSKAEKVRGLPPKLIHFQGSHPVPDVKSLFATTVVEDAVTTIRPDELVLCLISGGTSALLTDPVLPLPHWQQLNEALLACGCTINEINTVRQFFDRVKGGGLAAWAAPSQCVSLILSDVIGNNLAHIGSGPTVPVVKDPAAVREILDTFKVWSWLPEETSELVEAHLAQTGLETPTVDGGHHLIIGDVSTATAAVAAQTAEWGFKTAVVSNQLTGEARKIGQMAAERVKALRPNHCLIWGGESTVTIRGKGRGGRNQEMALAAAIGLDGGPPGYLVLAFSTDGEDGPTPVAGAWVTEETVGAAREKGLNAAEFLANNDSYTFFEQLGWGHVTAERGTNVNDILVAMRISEAHYQELVKNAGHLNNHQGQPGWPGKLANALKVVLKLTVIRIFIRRF